MSTDGSLASYLEEITGESPDISPLARGEDAALPLFLRSLYELRSAVLFGHSFLLAFQKDQIEQPTPSEYAKHASQISQIMGIQTILVLHKLASYSRNRLVRQGVPFVVPRRQMFLPTLLIDLRERFPRQVHSGSEMLTAPSQVLVIFYLLGNAVDGISLRKLAERLGYSAMTLSNVRDELESQNLCQVVKDGRSRHLHFKLTRAQIWETAKSRLQSPVRARHWVTWSKPDAAALRSGVTALAELSLVSEDRLPTFAMRYQDYRKQLETGTLHGCPESSEADAQVEAWKYDPAVLSQQPTVDRLSLYLSLRTSDDERIQSALEGILKEMPW